MKILVPDEKPASVCPRTADDAPYGLDCVLPNGHDGACHAHWFGPESANECSCGLKSSELDTTCV